MSIHEDAELIGAQPFGKGYVIARWVERNSNWQGYSPDGASCNQGYRYTVARTLRGLVNLGVPIIAASTVRRRAAKQRIEDQLYAEDRLRREVDDQKWADNWPEGQDQ